MLPEVFVRAIPKPCMTSQKRRKVPSKVRMEHGVIAIDLQEVEQFATRNWPKTVVEELRFMHDLFDDLTDCQFDDFKRRCERLCILGSHMGEFYAGKAKTTTIISWANLKMMEVGGMGNLVTSLGCGMSSSLPFSYTPQIDSCRAECSSCLGLLFSAEYLSFGGIVGGIAHRRHVIATKASGLESAW